MFKRFTGFSFFADNVYFQTSRRFLIFMRRTAPLEPLEPIEPIESSISGYALRFALFQQERMNDQLLNMIQ